jgi:hypothetical protein
MNTHTNTLRRFKVDRGHEEHTLRRVKVDSGHEEHIHTLRRGKVDNGNDEHTHVTIMLSDVVLFCNMFV